ALAILIHQVGVAPAIVRLLTCRKLPVALDGHRTVPPDERMAGRQAHYTFEQSLVSGRRMGRQVVRQGSPVQRRLHRASGEQCLDLRCKPERAIAPVHIVEWLYSKAIAGKYELTLLRIPQSDCKHPAKLRNGLHTVA